MSVDLTVLCLTMAWVLFSQDAVAAPSEPCKIFFICISHSRELQTVIHQCPTLTFGRGGGSAQSNLLFPNMCRFGFQ